MPSLSDPFAPVRLYHDEIIVGTSGGPEFVTQLSTNHGGYEQRNAQWAYALGRWELGQRGYCQSTKDYLTSFFRQRRGRYQAFLWRDLSDWQASAVPLPTKDGFSTQGLLRVVAPNIAQLFKRYTDGTYSAERRITQPVASSLVLPLGWTLFSGAGNGGIDAPGALPGGADLPVSFEFDVPVRFDTDALRMSLRSTEGHPAQAGYEAIFDVESLPIVEVRQR